VVKDGRAMQNMMVFKEKDQNLPQMFDRMQDGELKDIIFTDSIILKHCGRKIESLGTADVQKSNDIYRVNSTGRLMARIVKACREKLGSPMMTEIIVPDMIDNLISIAMAQLSAAWSLGMQIGFALGHAAVAKQGLATRKDKAMAEDALQFKILLKEEWNDCVTSALKKKIDLLKRTKQRQLPGPDDLLNLKSFIVQQMSDLCIKLTSSPRSTDWLMLAKMIMSRLNMFNKRR